MRASCKHTALSAGLRQLHHPPIQASAALSGMPATEAVGEVWDPAADATLCAVLDGILNVLQHESIRRSFCINSS